MNQIGKSEKLANNCNADDLQQINNEDKISIKSEIKQVQNKIKTHVSQILLSVWPQ